MKEVFEGQCQCGELSYRIAGETIALFACHCTECQRQSASAFGMALWLRDYSKEVMSGDIRHWVRRMSSGQELICEFCSSCGARIFHQVADQNEIMSIKPGTLDNTRHLRPVAHIWTSSAQPWIQFADESLLYPKNPESFDAIIATWIEGKRNTGGLT